MGYIGRKAATTMLHSARTAERCGRPLNVMVTIRLWELGTTPLSAVRDFGKVRSGWFRPWSARAVTRKGKVITPANGTPTHIYTIENTEGVHVHWLVHIRHENILRFQKALHRRLRSQFGMEELPYGALDFQTVHNAEGAKLYLVKAMDPLYAKLWGIEHKDGGDVQGRRADASRNLGPGVWKPAKAQYLKAKKAARTNKQRNHPLRALPKSRTALSGQEVSL